MREERTHIVYILASGHYGTLYIGVTNDIYRRMHEHRAGKGGIFTRKYKVARLVHMEGFGFIEDAIKREKQLKHWRRDWKINLIEREIPIGQICSSACGDSSQILRRLSRSDMGPRDGRCAPAQG